MYYNDCSVWDTIIGLFHFTNHQLIGNDPAVRLISAFEVFQTYRVHNLFLVCTFHLFVCSISDRIQSGTVKFGVDNYYRVRLSKTLSTHALPYTLRITATSRSGLAAIYISCLSNTPGYSNYIWYVRMFR